MRRKARTDSNHADVVKALRSAGWTVFDTSRLGNGFSDLVAARHGRVEFVEVKDGRKPPSARLLTMAEIKFCDALDKAGIRVRIVTSIEEAVRL